jgi:hypothetical protein
MGGERLVGDSSEDSGDLYSILCLLRGDEMESMANIMGCKLAGTTRRVLWEVGTVLGVNFGYSRSANTSRSINLLH